MVWGGDVIRAIILNSIFVQDFRQQVSFKIQRIKCIPLRFAIWPTTDPTAPALALTKKTSPAFGSHFSICMNAVSL